MEEAASDISIDTLFYCAYVLCRSNKKIIKMLLHNMLILFFLHFDIGTFEIK